MATSTAVAASSRARQVGILQQFKDLRGGSTVFLPQRVGVIGQGSTLSTYSTDKFVATASQEVGNKFGFGSPLHLAALQLLPINGDGLGSVPCTFYPLQDDGSGVAATGSITPVVSQTEIAAYKLIIGGVDTASFTIAIGATVADVTASITTAINSTLNVPVTAVDNSTDVDINAKWKGASGNDISIIVEGSATAGTTFGITAMATGAVNPDVDPALAQVGDIWETLYVSCFDIADTTTLDKYQTFNEGRYLPLVNRPAVFVSGLTESDVNTAIIIPDARRTDRSNSAICMPGSREMPLTVAARAVARAAARSNSNPAYATTLMNLSGLEAGTDGQQWTVAQREQAFQGGVATTEKRDGVPYISDFITFYHPTGDATPSHRYLVDICKVSNIVYQFKLEFESLKWAGVPLIPDNQPINTNTAAKRPRTAVTAINGITDGLAANAIVSDPDFAKANTFANISESNPNRLDISYTCKISGHVSIISVDLNWGFFFGQAQVIEG
jgi:phage tail sheath gpL-like